jgi:hypothetical protein
VSIEKFQIFFWHRLNFVLFCRYAVPKPRAECTPGEQLVVTFAAGYIAGVFCAIVSHPADTVVSKLNQAAKGASALDVAKQLGFSGKEQPRSTPRSNLFIICFNFFLRPMGWSRTQDCHDRYPHSRTMVHL